MQGCQSPWNRRGSKGAMPPPQILTDNLILYLNKGRQIMPTILLTAASPHPPLCVEMGFYADISWESICNIEINV